MALATLDGRICPATLAGNMTELDDVLQPHASRLRREPPYPLVIAGTYVDRSDGAFVRLETAALVGPVRGGITAEDGDSVVAVVPPDGRPVIVYSEPPE
jgi:hypothetical protein